MWRSGRASDIETAKVRRPRNDQPVRAAGESRRSQGGVRAQLIDNAVDVGDDITAAGAFHPERAGNGVPVGGQ